jgi:uncharacterized protein (TIGR00369 family)
MTSVERPPRWREMEERYTQSPIHSILGLTLKVLAAGHVEIHYDGRKEAANRRGNPAGGTLAQMVDSAVMQSVGTLLSESDSITTLELKINYLGAAEPGATLVARGNVEHCGKSTAVGTARIENAEQRVVAVAIVTVSIRRALTERDIEGKKDA